MSFFQLPAEIRVDIYGLMALPFEVPVSEYRGLYMSCRQVKMEMDYECSKVLEKYVTKCEAILTNLGIPMRVVPSQPPGVCCIEMTKPTTIWYEEGWRTVSLFDWGFLLKKALRPDNALDGVAFLNLEVFRLSVQDDARMFDLDCFFWIFEPFHVSSQSRLIDEFCTCGREQCPRRIEVFFRIKGDICTVVCRNEYHKALRWPILLDMYDLSGWDIIWDINEAEEYSTILIRSAAPPAGCNFCQRRS
jgi:hypothetical protein